VVLLQRAEQEQLLASTVEDEDELPPLLVSEQSLALLSPLAPQKHLYNLDIGSSFLTYRYLTYIFSNNVDTA
jgi:hypothetical protein